MSSQEAPPVAETVQPVSFTAPVAPPSNLIFGILAGGVAAVIGALVWAGIAYATEMVIGYIAIGVGFLVGLAIRRFGRGSSATFGVAGAVLALAGCILGDLLAGVAMASKQSGVAMVTIFQSLPPDIVLEMLKEQEPMGWVIYGIAVFAGFKYSTLPTAPAEQPAAA